MKITLVNDIDNSCYPYILSEAGQDDLIITYNHFCKFRLFSLIRENRKYNIYTVKDYLKEATKKEIIKDHIPAKKLLRSGLLVNRFSNSIERYYVLGVLTQIYKGQLQMEEEDCEKFFQKYNKNPSITLQDYLTFIKAFNKQGFYTVEHAMKEAIDLKMPWRYKRLFVPFYESYGELGLRFLKECFEVDEVFFIGDPYKTGAYYASDLSKIYKESIHRKIKLSDELYLPERLYKLYNEIKAKHKFPYKATLNGQKGLYKRTYNLEQGFEIFKSMIKTASTGIVAYDIPIFASQVEALLYEENIPFDGIFAEYKLPVELYNIYMAMKDLMDGKYLTAKQVRLIIQSLNSSLSSYFGGKAKLLRLFSLPMYSPSVLNKTRLFGYLRKLFVEKTFYKALSVPKAIEFSRWQNKFKADWIKPKVISASLSQAKALNCDVLMFIEGEYDDNPKMLYTAITIAKHIIHVKLGKNQEGGKKK